MSFSRTAVLGAGGWGTALAALWAQGGNEVILWGHNPERAEQLRSTRENTNYLPGKRLPESIQITSELRDCVEAELVVVVTPSVAVRATLLQARPFIRKDAVLLSCTKGIEHGTGLRMTQILSEICPGHTVAVLSGPNLAIEVSRNLPTATVIGCDKPECAQELQRYLGSSRFRIYSTDDTTGVELGGALKNVFAVAAGVSDGFSLGDNSKAALVTRSLAELLRLGTAMGGNARTFYGLSGAGDLVATCFSQHSRNRRVGEQIGLGKSIDEITSSTKTVAEGIPTTKSAYECARRLNIDTPIIDQVYAVVYEGKPPAQALEELLGRDQKAERI